MTFHKIHTYFRTQTACYTKSKCLLFKVLSKIQSTQESMSTLSDQLNSFRKKFDHETSDELFENEEDVANYALAAQIKLLMDIPERIWNAIEAREFVTATKFYLFARHIHTNLTFHHEENLGMYSLIS